MTTVVDCVKYLPTKSSIYACFACLWARKFPSFTAQVVGKIVQSFEDAVRSREYVKAELLLRFLVELANVHLVDEVQSTRWPTLKPNCAIGISLRISVINN